MITSPSAYGRNYLAALGQAYGRMTHHAASRATGRRQAARFIRNVIVYSNRTDFLRPARPRYSTTWNSVRMAFG
jgi:hypothetical protein